MIRRLTIALLALACGVAGHAETHYRPHISVGVHGGADVSKVTFSPSIRQKWQMGPTGGISIRYAEERLVGILAEVNYEQRGWTEDFEESPLSYTRSIGYISVPVMTHIYFGSPRCKCFFNLGPEFSYMISEKTKANFDYTNPFAEPDWPEGSRMTAQMTMPVKNKFDYGICAGFGVEFYATPRNSMYIEGRYYFGLGNIFSATKADVFGASRNMSIAVTLGYNFRIY